LRIKSFNTATLVLCFSHALLLGCGGGGEGEDLNPPQSGNLPLGAYAGTLTGSTSDDFLALALPGGEFWSIYGYDTGSVFYVDGFVQGSGTSNRSTFTTHDSRDFGFVPALHLGMIASYDIAARTINGTSTYDGQTIRFSGGPISGSLYRYEDSALLTTVSGHWDAMSTEGRMVSVNITNSGTLTLSDGGCTGSGTIRNQNNGGNVFIINVTFGGFPCAMPNQTATGIAVAYPLSTGQTQMIAAVTNSARTVGIAVFGIR